jgi:plasmid stabilization system protein ParE
VRRVLVRPAAAADIEDAYEHPEAYPVLHRDTRRVLIAERFPYAIFYRIYGDTVVVVACLHAKRDPRRWQRRT